MPILDDKRLDFIWKKLIFGVTETSVVKDALNETIRTFNIVPPDSIWADYANIDIPAPGVTTAEVQFYSTSSSVRCKLDTTVSNRRTWVAVVDIGQPINDSNRLKDWVPPSVDASYLIKVYAGDPNVAGIQINPLTKNEEWVFDYQAGVLHFPNIVPVKILENDVYIVGYRYIGTKGASVIGGGITTLNTLTNATQTFATGTTGTNFNIQSSGSTHTFHIPDASSSARGLLTSSDWSTFNNKVPTTRTISAGVGLTGGGDLSINRTISISAPISVTLGGTGLTTIAANKILFSSSLNTISELSLSSHLEIAGAVLQLKDSTVGEVKLDINNTPTDGYFLSWNNSAGKMEWAEIIGGSGNMLGSPTDGDLTNPRFPGAKGPAVVTWTPSTLVVDAIDDLNEIVGLLQPDPPPNLSTKSISMINGANTRSGINILLSSGVTDNTTGGAPSAGTQIYRITSSTATSSTVSVFGSGNSGTLQSIINGSVDGSIALNSSNNAGSNNSLVITLDEDYPISQPNFWQALTAYISSTIAAGINKFQLNHTETGGTNETFFVYDNISNTPSTSSITALEDTPGTLVYSSGIAHYPSGAILDITTTISNLASNAYLATNVIEITSNPIIGTQININPGEDGLPNPFTLGMGPQTITNKNFTISGTIHTASTIRSRGRNANTDGAYLDTTNIIHVMSGNPSASGSGPIKELDILINNLGTTPGGADTNAKRVGMSDGDNPADDLSALLVSNWNSTSIVAAHEGKIVGGTLKNSLDNYASGFLPIGPNYSTHNATQYAVFFFRRSAVSQFKINVTGTYSGMWVKMFGISNIPNAPNGWFNMFQLYDGSGVPGGPGNGPGCALGTVASGSTGEFTCTFGTENSTNSTNNIILVRFKLATSQAITGLEFKS